jgi:hypothetical protein
VAQNGAVRRCGFNLGMIEPEKALAIEAQLAELAGVPVAAMRDYLNGNIRAGRARRTGYRFVRGTHGGTYVRDPNGIDIMPAFHEAPV